MNLPLLREPLLQFLVLGGVLFALFSIVDRKEADAPAKIVVSTARVAQLADSFTRTWRRPPTEQELQDLIENHIREEVFYREGQAAGLDRDDVVIRRRVRQKMEFIVEDMVDAEPTEEQVANSSCNLSRAVPGRGSSYVPPCLFERNEARRHDRGRRQAGRERACSRRCIS